MRRGIQLTISYKEKVNNSQMPLDLSRKYNQNSRNFEKPYGVWYSLDYHWHKVFSYQDEESFRKWINPIDNILDIDMTDILVIRTPEDVLALHTRYGRMKRGRIAIQWNKVATDFSGIEIPFWYRSLNKLVEDVNTVWLDTWELDSGCTWDLSVIKDYHAQPCAYLSAKFRA
jgi:hypothetical protein